jgi:selenocysteine lyase/cysteine desulfurase
MAAEMAAAGQVVDDAAALGYGGALRSRFGLEKDYTQLNHGSFGVCPPDVNDNRKALLDHVEMNPDAWIGHHGPEKSYRPLMNEAKDLIAAELHIPNVDDIVLVENASSGINAVLRSFPWKPGDKILYLNCAYGMVQNVLQYLVKTHAVELVVVEMEPTGFKSPEAVLSAVADVVAANGGPTAFTLSVISHITSVPAVILPVREFCDLLGPTVPVVVDGAHALGQLDVDVPALGCHAYTGNLHKWLYSPKGTAMLWASPEFQKVCSIVPPVLSSESGGGNFSGDFEYTGTRDYTGYCAIPAAFKFRDSLPGSKQLQRDYGHNLAVWGGRYLAERFGTRTMEPASMTGWITNVELPMRDGEQMDRIKAKLLSDHYTNVTFYGWGGRFWQRLSCPAYVGKAEVEEYAERTLALIAEDEEALVAEAAAVLAEASRL